MIHHLPYKKIKLIGRGSFGEVYEARNLENNQKIAVKVEFDSTPNQQIQNEGKIMKSLSGSLGFPSIYDFKMETDSNILIMNYLGKSLQNLFEKCGKKFSLKTVLMIADQILTRIQFLHLKGFLHCDLKPANFVIGRHHNQANIIYLIDFGLSCHIKKEKIPTSISAFNDHNHTTVFTISHSNSHHEHAFNGFPPIFSNHLTLSHNNYNDFEYVIKSGQNDFNFNQDFRADRNIEKAHHKCLEENKTIRQNGLPFVGTTRFSSINANMGGDYSMKDDMESIGYILIYFLKGFLPWEGIHEVDIDSLVKRVLKIKTETTLEQLCQDLPNEFLVYMTSVRNLGKNEIPPYAKYRKLFRDLFVKKNFVYDMEFDWLLQNEHDESLTKLRISHMSTPIVLRKSAAEMLFKMEQHKKKAKRIGSCLKPISSFL